LGNVLVDLVQAVYLPLSIVEIFEDILWLYKKLFNYIAAPGANLTNLASTTHAGVMLTTGYK
jgi:hypothetical protein